MRFAFFTKMNTKAVKHGKKDYAFIPLYDATGEEKKRNIFFFARNDVGLDLKTSKLKRL